ncbi:MAG: SIMPL domain-containing protein [Acidimicrobiales bacterium]
MNVTSPRRRLAVGAVALAGVVLAAGATVAGADPVAAGCGPGGSKLTVHGTGVASGTPDLLTLALAVDVAAGDAHDALAADDTATASVLSTLAGGGVRRRNVQTTGLTIQPDYSASGQLTGYSVTDDVVAKIRDLATAGSVIDAAAGASGNDVRVDSLTFSLADPRGLQDRARRDAVHQAVSHAGTMAAAAGERLGRICSLTDDSSSPGPNRYPLGTFGASAQAAPGVPLEPGTQQATARVTLVYAVGPSGRRRG